MKRSLPALALVVAALLSACGGGSDPETFEDTSFQRISAPWAHTSLRETYVIRDQAAWERAWHAHEPRTEPASAPPQVDFTEYMILGITLGTGPSGCDGLEIRKVLRSAWRSRVEYVQSFPPPGRLCTTELSPLTDFVRVPRADTPVEFERAGA